MRRALSVAALSAFLASGCLMPPGRDTKLSDAARNLNVATRFGRLDVAAQLTAEETRTVFLERRAEWGGAVRILDVEIAGIELSPEDAALVQVDVSWIRNNESVVRTTRVAQVWREGKSDWLLEREKRVSGDLGLFGDAPPAPAAATLPTDRYFPSRTIR